MTMRLPPSYISQDWVYKDGYVVYTYKQYIIARNARKDILAHNYDLTLFDTIRAMDDWTGRGAREAERRYYH